MCGAGEQGVVSLSTSRLATYWVLPRQYMVGLLQPEQFCDFISRNGIHQAERSGEKEGGDSESPCPKKWQFKSLAPASKLLPENGGRDSTCMRCEQVDDLLSIVAALKEEVERLRSTRECEQVTVLKLSARQTLAIFTRQWWTPCPANAEKREAI